MKYIPQSYSEPAERQAALTAERNRKMAASAHAYVRGSTTRFYEWLERSDRCGVPDGPDIWICGDCHVGNIGPVARGVPQDWGCGGQLAIFAFVLWPRVDAWLGC